MAEGGDNKKQGGNIVKQGEEDQLADNLKSNETEMAMINDLNFE